VGVGVGAGDPGVDVWLGVAEVEVAGVWAPVPPQPAINVTISADNANKDAPRL